MHECTSNQQNLVIKSQTVHLRVPMKDEHDVHEVVAALKIKGELLLQIFLMKNANEIHLSKFSINFVRLHFVKSCNTRQMVNGKIRSIARDSH